MKLGMGGIMSTWVTDGIYGVWEQLEKKSGGVLEIHVWVFLISVSQFLWILLFSVQLNCNTEGAVTDTVVEQLNSRFSTGTTALIIPRESGAGLYCDVSN